MADDDRVHVLLLAYRVSKTGGVPRVIRTFLETYDRRALRVTVCSLRPLLPDDELDEYRDAADFVSLDLPAAPGIGRRALAGIRLHPVLRRLRPDVAWVMGGIALTSLALVARRVPRLLEVQDAPSARRHHRLTDAFEMALVRWLGYRAVVHTHATKAEMVDGFGVPAARVSVTPLGVDLPADPRHRPAAARSVLYVARLVASKRPEEFLAVAEQLVDDRPDVCFDLVGGGPLEDQLRRRASTHPSGRIVVHGAVPAVEPFHAAAAAFLSTSEYEGFGLAVADAMAHGVPVVAAHGGGVGELVVDGETGFLVAVGDAQAAAERVAQLLDDPRLADRLGQAGRARIEAAFTERLQVRSMEQELLRLAGR